MLKKINIITILIVILYFLFFISLSLAMNNHYEGKSFWEMPYKQWHSLSKAAKNDLLNNHMDEWKISHPNCETPETFWDTENGITKFYVQCFEKESEEHPKEFKGNTERRI